MIKEHKEYITKAKHAELTAELEQLKTIDRKAIAEKLDYARSLGDLSENAEYHDARDQQSDLESKIEHIEGILNSAEIVEHVQSDIVAITSQVTIKKEGASSDITYEIVGSAEADMAAKKLSYDSPLAQAMLGKKVGESVELETPNGKVVYVIEGLS